MYFRAMCANVAKLEMLMTHRKIVRSLMGSNIIRNISFSSFKRALTTSSVYAKNLDSSDQDIPMHELVTSLSIEQRHVLLSELQKLESAEARKKAEEKLASWRWRSRFGRPSSLHKLGADPTGTYCQIPEGWLKEKAAVAAKPTAKQLKELALFNALPFIGFGFLDNLIMIIAGDYIDMTIGTALGISTMAAAALGNTISDLAGIGSAWYVESAADRVGVRAPNLTPQQLESSGARWSANLGRALGVVFGCLIGMFPLLFMSRPEDKDKTKKIDKKEVKTEEESK